MIAAVLLSAAAWLVALLLIFAPIHVFGMAVGSLAVVIVACILLRRLPRAKGRHRRPY